MATPSEDPQAHGGPLSGRTVLVTGASSGIGSAIARAAAAAGADVALTYLANADGARAVAREITATGGQAELFQLDLREERSISELAPQPPEHLDGWMSGSTMPEPTSSPAATPS